MNKKKINYNELVDPSKIQTSNIDSNFKTQCLDSESENLKYTYGSKFESIKARTLGEAENDELFEIKQSINRIINEKEDPIHLVMFVFGITGSGKDNFLNLIYGLLFNDKEIHDQTDKGRDMVKYPDVKNIDYVLNSKKDSVEEDWYYVNTDNKNTLDTTNKGLNKNYENVKKYNIDGQEKTYKDYMVEATPFNDQSTRGFNIKNINQTGIKTKEKNIFSQ